MFSGPFALPFTRLLTLALLIASPAFAANDVTVASFQNAASSIPNKLLAQGYRNFGRLDLQTLVQRMDSVHVTAVGSIRRPERLGDVPVERDSAEWNRSGAPFIRVNSSRWAKTPAAVRNVIALHEHLGVAGYEDRHYVISTGMWLLAHPDSHQIMNPSELQGVTDRIQQEASAQGGVTGVGGGGDEHGARVKMTRLDRTLKTLGRAAGGDARVAALHDLYASFYMNDEINRSPSKGWYKPVLKEQVTGGYNFCESVLKMSDTARRAELQRLHSAGNPEVLRKLPDVKSMVKFCTRLTKRGLKRTLQDVDES